MSEFKVKTGICAMHHMNKNENGKLVYIERETTQGWFSIAYVPNGGFSSSWAADEFKPVTDPVLLAVSKAYLARRSACDLERESRSANKEAEIWDGVVEVLKEINGVVSQITPPALEC